MKRKSGSASVILERSWLTVCGVGFAGIVVAMMGRVRSRQAGQGLGCVVVIRGKAESDQREAGNYRLAARVRVGVLPGQLVWSVSRSTGRVANKRWDRQVQAVPAGEQTNANPAARQTVPHCTAQRAGTVTDQAQSQKFQGRESPG